MLTTFPMTMLPLCITDQRLVNVGSLSALELKAQMSVVFLPSILNSISSTKPLDGCSRSLEGMTCLLSLTSVAVLWPDQSRDGSIVEKSRYERFLHIFMKIL